jgi:hypothetical protein
MSDPAGVLDLSPEALARAGIGGQIAKYSLDRN